MSTPLRLLLVEDNDDDAVLIGRALRQAGFEATVRRANTRSEFLALLDEGPDLVISDHALPDFSSLAALACLRDRGLDLPFIVVSGTLDEESAVTIMRAGAHDFITKQKLARLGPAIARELEEARGRAERRRAQRDLRIQRDFLRLVIDANPGLIFVKDANGVFTLANRAVADLLGLPVDELAGGTHRERNGAGAFLFAEREVLDSGVPRVVDAEPLVDARTGETRWFDTRMVPLIAPDGSAQVLGIGTEITERRRAEEALRTTEEQLRHAQKMEAVGQLAGGVAHDFNNLLTVILGYGQLVYDQADHPEIRGDVGEILAAGERAESLVRQLLAFSRKQVLAPEILDVSEVLQGVQKLLRRVIGETIALEIAAAPDLPRVRADRGQIEQVLINLAINARDAMPQGGTLTMTTAAVAPPPTLPAPSGRADRCVAIVVADTGHGMPADVRSRIFEPFYTTKPPGKGTGLGLSVVYGVVTQSGGAIDVESEPGKGTRFTIWLPPTSEADAPAATAARVPSQLQGNETILLVEDDGPTRELVRKVLGRYGYRIVDAADPRAAIELAGRHAGPLHLLLTDIVMPYLSGPELFARLSERHPALRVLYISGFAESASGIDTSDPAGVLLKPFTPDRLAARVRERLNREAAGWR